MTLAPPPTPVVHRTLADLLESLGGVPPDRVRVKPFPGTATEDDVFRIDREEGRLYELVDGVLVEKAMGYHESVIAMELGRLLGNHVSARKLGVVSGEGGMVTLYPGLIRIPDIAFVTWSRIKEAAGSSGPAPHFAPELAVEVLSRSNTVQEMDRKRGEYFASGVRLVWLIHPKSRTVAVYTGPGEPTILHESDTLDGGDVLPGFTVSLRALFATLDHLPPL